VTLVDVEIGDLWAAYRRDGHHAARDELILRYAPLVQYVAGRLGVGLPSHVERADLVSYGIFGLIDAVERFDPDRGCRFETYAIARIKGNILDELRSLDWVPRSVRAKARSIDRALARLEAKLHRSPSDAELADALGMNDGQLRQALSQVSLMSLVTFDAAIGVAASDDQPLTVGDTLADGDDDPLAAVELAELRRSLADAIERLSERERVVVSLYYHDGLTLAEIGEVLGVTESRACQIHAKAVSRLRIRMTAAGRLPA
jgi:RNA polymerase sigma factor for flagellar operon FliA